MTTQRIFKKEQLKIHLAELEKGHNHKMPLYPADQVEEIAIVRSKIRYQKKKLEGTSRQQYLEHKDEILIEQKKWRAQKRLDIIQRGEANT